MGSAGMAGSVAAGTDAEAGAGAGTSAAIKGDVDSTREVDSIRDKRTRSVREGATALAGAGDSSVAMRSDEAGAL